MKFFLSLLNFQVKSLLNFQKSRRLLGVILVPLIIIVLGQTILVEKFGFSNVIYAQGCISPHSPCTSSTPSSSCCGFPANKCTNLPGSGYYCWPEPTPLPTPSAGPCTGLDGLDPCRQYNCGGSPSDCEIKQGTCINGYCYPKTCRDGQSKNDCRDGYTCQSGQCKSGFIQCTAGQAQVPCSGKQDCVRECGVTTVDCQNSVCVSSISPNPQCDSQGGACVDPSTCSVNRELIGKLGCQGIFECCKPIAQTGSNLVPYDPECVPGGTHGNNYGGVKTALGCLPTDPQAFIYIITPWAIGIGAGIAFLLGLYGSLMIVISAGDPEKMQAGKEIITSAIAGSLLIIFAVFILRIIGIDILKLF